MDKEIAKIEREAEVYDVMSSDPLAPWTVKDLMAAGLGASWGLAYASTRRTIKELVEGLEGAAIRRVCKQPRTWRLRPADAPMPAPMPVEGLTSPAPSLEDIAALMPATRTRPTESTPTRA